MKKKIRIGTRTSALAMAQTHLVMAEIQAVDPEATFEIVPLNTLGDRILDKPLLSFGGKGAFVSEFEEALLKDEIDLAVHSAKDMPMELPSGLALLGSLKREDPRDVLVTMKGTTLKEGAVIGTSSLRRQLQIKQLQKVACQDIRGNVNTRLRKLEEGQYDGLILAAAGLKRLGLDQEEKFDYHYFPCETFVPAGGQGIIAVEGREGDALALLMEKVTDQAAQCCLEVERHVLKLLDAGCHEPLGVYSTIEEDKIHLTILNGKGDVAKRVEGKDEIINGKALADRLVAAIKGQENKKNTGCVYLVGAGPGEKELITVKGLECLRRSEVVVYDRLATPELLEEVPANCERIDVGKVVGQHAISQEAINEILVQKGLEGKRVVRLKGGDPFVFGRGGEEIMALSRAGIPYQVVPGITSAIAAPAYAGIPVTHRGMSGSFHVITGYTITTESTVTDQFETLAALEGTLIFLMGMGNLEKITHGLMQYGKSPDTPAAIVSQGTTSRQRCLRATLGTLVAQAESAQMAAPAVIIIGETASLAFVYQGKEKLYGVRAGIVATSPFMDKLAQSLEQEGAKAYKIGTGKLEQVELDEMVASYLDDLAHWDWLVFTSSNAISTFFSLLQQRSIDHRKLSHMKFAVIGSGTGETLKKYGFIADYMPERYTASALGEGLKVRVAKGEKVLIPCAQERSEVLLERLTAGGICWKDLKIYGRVTHGEILRKRLQQLGTLDYLIFGSAGSVKTWFTEGGNLAAAQMQSAELVALGEVTAQALRSYGYEKFLVADSFTAEGIVEKLITYRTLDQ